MLSAEREHVVGSSVVPEVSRAESRRARSADVARSLIGALTLSLALPASGCRDLEADRRRAKAALEKIETTEKKRAAELAAAEAAAKKDATERQERALKKMVRVSEALTPTATARARPCRAPTASKGAVLMADREIIDAVSLLRADDKKANDAGAKKVANAQTALTSSAWQLGSQGVLSKVTDERKKAADTVNGAAHAVVFHVTKIVVPSITGDSTYSPGFVFATAYLVDTPAESATVLCKLTLMTRTPKEIDVSYFVGETEESRQQNAINRLYSLIVADVATEAEKKLAPVLTGFSNFTR